MSNTYITLTDLIKLNDLNARDNGISDLLNNAPVLKQMHACTASNGTQHKYLKLTTSPVANFRAINAGRNYSGSGYTEVTDTLQILDGTVIADKAEADSYRFGPEKFLERETRNSIQAAMFLAEQQIFYGTGAGQAAGFSGLGDDSHYSALAGSLVVNAAGTTASTGNSIWLIRSTPDETGVSAVIGNDGVISVGDVVETLKNDDSDATKFFPAYMSAIVTYMGLQIGGVYSAVRIGNITADSGKGATDKLISQGLEKFKAGYGPTMICMNRPTLAQLQQSRTATNPTGAPAPFPEESFGVPIIVTDALTSTETLLA